jgi:signal transduction histidine kinase
LDGVARVLAVVIALVACVVLVTWFVDATRLDLYSPGSATTKVNTALCLLAMAGTLLARRTLLVAVLCGAVALVASASLVEHVLGVGLGIDELLVRDVVSGEFEVPGRMAPATGVCLLLLAAARWAQHLGHGRAAQLVLVVPFAVGGVAQLGYLFRVEQLYSVVAYSTVALPTALALDLLALGIGCLVPGGVAWWMAKDPGAGATLLRHMLPVAVILLPVLGILPILGVYTDLFGPRFGIALMVACASVTLMVVTAVAARRIDRVDRERLAAQEGLRGVNDQLRERRDLEWRRAEQLSHSLGEERARFQRSIGKVDDLIWTVEVMPDGELRPEFTSGNASGLFGGEQWDVQDREIPSRVHPDDVDILQEFDDTIRAGLPAEAELRIVGYDDVVRWAWIRSTPRRERNQLFADGISTNITERRQLAERREDLLTLEQEQVRKLKQLNQLREELLAVTGHELRTPLAVILGYAELLLLDTDLTDVQRRHLGVMANRARQIALLVEDIFDLAKFSAGLSSIDARPVALHDAVAEAVEEHRPAAEGAQLTIDMDVTEVTVAADPPRLRQILDNLLSNAIKYSLPGGHVAVTTQRNDAMATISVSDAGIGIPDGELEHIFDRMYRATSAKDREIQGTGLGLSVAKVLVEAHAGTISVTNRPEGGTRFTVSIPVAHEGSGSGGRV